AGRLYAVAFDLRRLQTAGDPEVVVDGVRYDPRNGAAHFAVSSSGTLIYTPGVPISAEQFLVWVSETGGVKPVLDAPRIFRGPRLSRDGARIAAVVGPDGDTDLWLVEPNGALTRSTFGLAPHRPIWRPDGRGITVAARQRDRWRLLTLTIGGQEQQVLL